MTAVKTKTYNVIVIDDSEIDLELLALIISDLPQVNVLKFRNSSEALKLLSKKNPITIDLVLCDYEMPKFNGLDLLIKFRNNSFTPFIFISAYISTKLVNLCKSEGATGFIVKPFVTRDLLAKIKKAMNYIEQ